MKKYDDFKPSIPEEEGLPMVDTLPPVSENVPPSDPPRKEKREKTNKDKRRKPVKENKNKSVSLPERIKRWATGQTTRWLLGIFMGFFALYLGTSFLSYFGSCIKDQSEINNNTIGEAGIVSNLGGEGGARISEFLINECFGLGSFVILVWLVAMSLKQLTGRPRFKSVDFTIKCLVALITVSLIIGLVTVGLKSPVNWGGYHGRYVNEFIIHFVGWTGAVILCAFMIACFIVICMRDAINWLIRVKHKRDERKRIEAEENALRMKREAEIEEMRRLEEADSSPETIGVESKEALPDDAAMHFDEDEIGLYTSLPDFEATEYSIEDEEENSLQIVDHGSLSIDNRLQSDSQAHLTNERRMVDSGLPADIPDNLVTAGESDSTGEMLHSHDGGMQENDMVVNINTISQTNAVRVPDNAGLPGAHPYKFPPVELLKEGQVKVSVDSVEQMENKEKIKKTLLDFGIPIVSIEATVGPTVTLYEIVPDKGIKIAKIRALTDDLALSLSAEGVRIIAPIPGKGTVGIEVANKEAQTVSMRTVIKSKAYQESKFKLPIALGSTISNEVFIADLAKMPHLLVAGATGQGKSVGLNAIVTSLLYCKSPDELKFVMVDPKKVEFSLYKKLEPHYLAKIPDAEEPIITDTDKVVATLSSLCVEMDNRYLLLKDANTRNIVEYNTKIKEKKLNPLDGHKYLPYIVVIVDEFSDLIMTAGKEVEIPIARLAQLARAVGIHVIIATQRPSTNVITGIIKANFPARIAFKVSSGVDSKTILDTTGAQQLIGRGDMLISNGGPMVRVQCAFVDTPEVEEVCDYIARQPYGQGAYELPEPAVTGSGDSDSEPGGTFGDKDPLFDEVARLIVSSNTASTSSLQRRYSIGYNRAGKIMDQLEAAGIVGPAHGGKPRSVLVDAVTLESMLS